MRRADPSAVRPHAPDQNSDIPVEERAALAEAINGQRKQLWRAHAITLTAARLLHETFDVEVDEPDIAYALDAAAQIVADVIDRLDPTNLHLPG